MPQRSKLITPHGSTAWIEIRLREGKKRQIRHTLAPGAHSLAPFARTGVPRVQVAGSAGVTAAVGLPTLRLVRVAIGPIEWGNLKPGEWRDLTQNELNLLKT